MARGTRGFSICVGQSRLRIGGGFVLRSANAQADQSYVFVCRWGDCQNQRQLPAPGAISAGMARGTRGGSICVGQSRLPIVVDLFCVRQTRRQINPTFSFAVGAIAKINGNTLRSLAQEAGEKT